MTIYELKEIPQKKPIYMLAGWRQWADAGSISSGLPRYLVERTGARHIGSLRDDGFYLFQFPGTHDLLRPVVEFDDGMPQGLEEPQNDFYYAEIGDAGVVIFLGDEPHMNASAYISAILDAAQALNVQRIVGLGGVYAEVPYNKERTVSSTYSRKTLRSDLDKLAVTYSNYAGGASINSLMCYLAATRNLDYASFYAFVPNYDLSQFESLENMIRLENDFTAWWGIMRRLNFFLHVRFDLSDLKTKSQRLISVLDDKVDEMDANAPGDGVRAYFHALSSEFSETLFDSLDQVWEDELRRLLSDEDDENAD